MTYPRQSLEEVTGYLGVGALLMLGIFLIVDGLTSFWVTLDLYSKTASFAILFTVPLLVIAYVLGLLASLVVQTIIDRVAAPVLGPELFASAVRKARDPLMNRYLEVERHSRLLYGCTLAFLVLGVGSLSVQRHLPEGQESAAIARLLLGLAISAACPFLARRLQVDLKRHVIEFDNHSAAAAA